MVCSYTGSLTVVLIKHLIDIPVPNPKGGDNTLWYIIGPASGFVLIAVLAGLLYTKRSSFRPWGRTYDLCSTNRNVTTIGYFPVDLTQQPGTSQT